MSAYPWLVYLHILAAFAFVLSHGASVAMSFGIRSERDPRRIAALLDISSATSDAMYISLLVLLVGGIAAGVVGQWFGFLWIWAAIVLLVLIFAAMYWIGSQYYGRVRRAIGQRAYGDPKGAPLPTPVSPEELAALLDSRRPEAIAAIGGIGLALIIWLMVFKPA
jgi:hypothetical protein